MGQVQNEAHFANEHLQSSMKSSISPSTSRFDSKNQTSLAASLYYVKHQQTGPASINKDNKLLIYINVLLKSLLLQDLAHLLQRVYHLQSSVLFLRPTMEFLFDLKVFFKQQFLNFRVYWERGKSTSIFGQ